MPEGLALDDDEILFGVEFGAQLAEGGIADCALDDLALAIFRVQRLGERQGRFQIRRQNQVQRRLGGFQPASCIEPRSELEADFVRAQLGRAF